MNLISELEAFQEARSRENYLHKSGQKKHVQMAPIFDKYKHILSKDTLESIKNIDKRENKFLYHSIVLNVINHAIASASDEEYSAEASVKINIDGIDVPLRQASIILLNESDVHKRKKIVEAIQNATRHVKTSLEAQLQARQNAILQLTGKKYLEYLGWVKEVDFETLSKDAAAVLLKTDTLHTRLMKHRIKKAGMTLQNITPEDWAHCTRAKEFDKWFPADSLLDSIKSVWRNLGCVFEKEVIVDFEDRPLKVPHAACHRIKVPQEIVIVARPRGGHMDYRTLLHESGHAMHYAHTDAGMHYAFRHLGDASVTETYAFLMAHLLADSQFLETNFEMPDNVASEFKMFNIGLQLYLLRRYAAKFLFEYKLHSNDFRRIDLSFKPVRLTYANAQDMYADIMFKATKIRHAPEKCFADVDFDMKSVDYLRAWFFEVVLRMKLERKWGSKWFLNANAGNFLKSLWRWGRSAKSIPELAELIGCEKVSSRYIINDFKCFFQK